MSSHEQCTESAAAQLDLEVLESPDRSTSFLQSAKKRRMLSRTEGDPQPHSALPNATSALNETISGEDNDQVESTSKQEPEQPGTGGVSEGDKDGTQVKADTDTMEQCIQQVRQKMDQFTQQVSGLLEAGKSYFHMAANDFEEKIVQLHQGQIEKWEREIQSLLGMHFENEDINYRLSNAQAILDMVHKQ